MTTATDVRVILPTDTTLTDAQIDAGIAAAECVLEESGCTRCEAQSVLYLAAHFCAVTENTLSLKSETDGCCDASVTYGFKFGEGIMGTPFGQMANTLSGGCLKASESNKPVGLYSLGCI